MLYITSKLNCRSPARELSETGLGWVASIQHFPWSSTCTSFECQAAHRGTGFHLTAALTLPASTRTAPEPEFPPLAPQLLPCPFSSYTTPQLRPPPCPHLPPSLRPAAIHLQVRIDKKAPDFIAWDDINGIDSVKREIEEIIEYLKNPALMRSQGVARIGGVLLAGAPGTGKTLLAKSIAAESGVRMFTCSGTDFVDVSVCGGAVWGCGVHSVCGTIRHSVGGCTT